MKKIYLFTLLSLIVLLIMDRGFSYVLDEYLFQKTLSGESGGNLNYLFNYKKDSKSIILGTSRAKHQIDPHELTALGKESTYNAGVNGVGLVIYQDVLTNIILNKGLKPDVLILQTDAYQFTEENGEFSSSELVRLYPYIDESNLMKKYLTFSEKAKLAFHTYRYNGKMLNLLFNYAKRTSVKDNNGYVGLQGNVDKIPSFNSEKQVEISSIKKDALVSIIQQCKENQIKLLVVFPPFLGNNILQFGTILSSLKELLAQHEILFYDFSDSNNYPELQSTHYWKDPTHLNHEGATLFSKILNEKIKADL